MNEIDNQTLKIEDIPSIDADWSTVSKFAITYNGYKVHGSFEACAKIAHSRAEDTLTALRTCLFFTQRAWNHFGDEPNAEAMTYIRSLVEKIRAKVAANERE